MINKKRSRNDWIKKPQKQGKFVLQSSNGGKWMDGWNIKVFENIFVAQEYLIKNHITGFIPTPYNDDT